MDSENLIGLKRWRQQGSADTSRGAVAGAVLTLLSAVLGSGGGRAQAQDAPPPPAAVASAIGAESSAADPSPQVQSEYRAVVARAVSEFDLGHIAEARALFLRAHELWPSARTLRTLGMTAFELRMYPRALEELHDALEAPRRPLPAEQRTQVSALIAQAEGFVGRYRVQRSPANAELLVDGQPVDRVTLVLSVGAHALLARAPGYGELRRELIVQGREDEALVLQLTALAPAPANLAVQQESAPESRRPSRDRSTAQVPSAPAAALQVDEPDRTLAFVAFGVGGAALVTGIISGLIAFRKQHDADLTAGHRAADISTASFIAAGVGAVLGTMLLLTAEPDSPGQAMQLRTTQALRMSVQASVDSFHPLLYRGHGVPGCWRTRVGLDPGRLRRQTHAAHAAAMNHAGCQPSLRGTSVVLHKPLPEKPPGLR